MSRAGHEVRLPCCGRKVRPVPPARSAAGDAYSRRCPKCGEWSTVIVRGQWRGEDYAESVEVEGA